MSLIKKYSILVIFLIAGIFFYNNTNSAIKITDKIKCRTGCKKIKEVSYILKNVQFRGYLLNKKSIEIIYLDKNNMEHFLLLKNTPEDLLEIMNNEAPVSITLSEKYLNTSKAILEFSKDLVRFKKLYYFKTSTSFFFFSSPNDTNYKDSFISYIEVQILNSDDKNNFRDTAK